MKIKPLPCPRNKTIPKIDEEKEKNLYLMFNMDMLDKLINDMVAKAQLKDIK